MKLVMIPEEIGKDIMKFNEEDKHMNCNASINIEDIIRKQAYDNYRKLVENSKYNYYQDKPYVKNVIFNPPCTIVLWTDNTKTIVRTQNKEKFDPEKGLAMAFAKKAFGNTSKYFDEIKIWTEPYLEKKKLEAKNKKYEKAAKYEQTKIEDIEDADR